MRILRYTLRSLWKSPGFTIAAIGTLALGIGATGAICTILYAMLFRTLPYSDSNNLVRIVWRWKDSYGPGVVPALADAVAQRSRAFSSVATVFPSAGCNLAGPVGSEYLIKQTVSSDFFHVLGISPILGRDFSSTDIVSKEPTIAIISYSLWQHRFQGSPDVLGRQFRCNGHPFSIVGVLPESFRYFGRGDIWFPDKLANYLSDPGTNYGLIARLRPGVSLSHAQQELDILFQQVRLEMPNRWWSQNGTRGMAVLDYRRWQFGQLREPMFVLFGAVVLVLLIACANVAGLMLVRASSRAKEVAVRLALGAKRLHIARQFLIEAIVLNLLGTAAGSLFAWLVLRFLAAQVPADTNFLGIGQLNIAELRPGVPVFLLLVAIGLLTGLLSGAISFVRLNGAFLSEALKQGGRVAGVDRESQKSRKILLGGEVALSFMLLFGALLLIRSFAMLQGVKLGFDPSGLQILQLSFASEKYKSPSQIAQFENQVIERLRALPGVTNAAAVSSAPLESGLNLPSPEVNGKECTSDGTVEYRAVSSGYFSVLRIPILRGHDFQLRDEGAGARVALINETLARMCWADQNPIGQQVWIGKNQGALEDAPREIVGVVADTKEYALDMPVPPMIFVPQSQVSANINDLLYHRFNLVSAIAVKTSGSLDVSVGAQRAVNSVDPEQPVVSIAPMAQIVGGSIAFSRLMMLLVTAFAVFAVVLTTVGLYGLFSYQAAVRFHEIGVRIALGADRLHIVRLVVLEGFLLVVIGGIAGLAGAFAEGRLLRNLLYGVTTFDPLAFGAALACLSAVVLVAGYLPARRALLVEPVAVLRYE